MARRSGWLGVGLSMACSAASAQTVADVTAALTAYTATPEHIGAAMATVRPYYALIPSCKADAAKWTGARVVTPISLDADGAIAAGAWVEQIKVDGCATSGLFNVFTRVGAGAPPRVDGLLPGTTVAPAVLQRDAFPTAKGIAITGLPAGCADVHAIDTMFDGFGEATDVKLAPSRDPRSRNEHWIFAGCGRQVTVAMRFIPDATGVTFDAKLENVSR